jgi:predicted ATPase
MHRLAAVTIENFRSCKRIELHLSDFTPFVGYNNAGKSNILRAIEWLVNFQVLGEADFCDPDQEVSVTAVVSGITDEVLGRLEEKHRAAVQGYRRDETLTIRRVQPRPGCAKKEVVLQVRHPENEEWKANPGGIDNAIRKLFPEPVAIGAMDNVAEDATKHKNTTTIGKLISKIVGQVQDVHGDAMQGTLDGLRAKLHADGADRPEEIRRIDEGASRALKEIFPGIDVKLHIPLPDIQTLFKSGTILCYDHGTPRPFELLGHGSQRSIQMALVRYLAEIERGAGEGSSRCLLLLEEPELYLHPHAIECMRDALKTLSRGSYQVLVATHSPLFISRADIPRTIQVRKNGGGTYAFPTLQAKVEELIEEAPHQADVLFSLSHSSQVLFADRVLLAEGKTEAKLLPILFEKIRETTLGAEKIALVGQGGGDNTRKCMELLAAAGMPAKAVVDLDKVFKLEEFLPEDDADLLGCKSILARLSPEKGFELTDRGLPKKGGALTPEQAYAELAKDPAAEGPIRSLHERLKAMHVWLWPRGAVEQHLGIEGKKDAVHARFVKRVEVEGVDDAVADAAGIRQFFDWLVG